MNYRCLPSFDVLDAPRRQECPVSRSRARDVRRVALLLLVGSLTATCAASLPEDDVPGWRSPGLIGNGGWPYSRAAVTQEDAEGGYYLPGSSVLALPGDRAR